jgi:hypothetical protein
LSSNLLLGCADLCSCIIQLFSSPPISSPLAYNLCKTVARAFLGYSLVYHWKSARSRVNFHPRANEGHNLPRQRHRRPRYKALREATLQSRTRLRIASDRRYFVRIMMIRACYLRYPCCSDSKSTPCGPIGGASPASNRPMTPCRCSTLIV